ncbi:MAG: PQQ-dependent sugar dehydrogenase [Pirellulales bacterium]
MIFSSAETAMVSRVRAGLFCCALIGTTICLAALVFFPVSKTEYRVESFDSRFSVQQIVDLGGAVRPEVRGALPTRLAINEADQIFLSIQLSGQEAYSGRIVELIEEQAANGQVRLKTIADSACLFRTFGLAARDGQIYVSRAGFLARANQGRLEYENTGTVTRLSDLDCDGIMDYYEDIVVNLPGCQGPNTQHQNNAITFGPEGELYIAQGVPNDRGLLSHPWHGKILRASPDFSEISIFASGFRNPFGLIHGPHGGLFCTDNDVTAGFNPGDELNLIESGAHYGHPYVFGKDDGGGAFATPLLLSVGTSSFAGIAYTESPELPEEYQGCLYIADFGASQILRITLNLKDDGYAVEAETFVAVPQPIDIAVTQSGDFYVTSYEGLVFRIRYMKK